MNFPLIQLHSMNRSRPIVEVEGIDGMLQWDYCDLEGLPPEVEGKTVYSIDTKDFNKSGYVKITMTLTTPSCPVGPEFLNNVKTRVEEIKEIKKCEVDLVWDPPWDPSMMSEEAQTMLGMKLNRPMLDGTRAGGNGSWE